METHSPHARRERERWLRRRDMLDAAKAVFAEKSYEEATVEEIAERAEFGKGTIYLYFKGGKQEILGALLDELMSEVDAHLRALVSDAEAGDRDCRGLLGEYVDWAVRHMVENHDLFAVTVKEWDRLTSGKRDDQRPEWAHAFDEPLGLLARFFGIAAERGAIRPTDFELLAHIFVNMLRGYVTAIVRREQSAAAVLTGPGSCDAARLLSSLFLDGAGAERAIDRM